MFRLSPPTAFFRSCRGLFRGTFCNFVAPNDKNHCKMNKQNIIIIGATSGIGKALFEKYAADGNRIGIVGRRAHLLDELRQEHPDMTVTATADITKQDEIARAIESTPTSRAGRMLLIRSTTSSSSKVTAISSPLPRLADCAASRWLQPTAHRKPTKSTTWKPCVKRHSRVVAT